MKILHVISGLFTGGAEMMLYKLLSRLTLAGTTNAVVSLTGAGPIGTRIAELAVPVTTLGMDRGAISAVAGFRALTRLTRDQNPDLVQTWMYHANLFGGLAIRFAGHRPVIWGIRQTDLSRQANKRSTILVAHAGAWLSRRLSQRVLYCSEASRAAHEIIGYDQDRSVVIPNGFDLDVFKPNAAARADIRREIGIDDETPLIGLAARFDVQKDHRNFLAAAALVRQTRPDVHLLLCGSGIDHENPQLAKWLAEFSWNGSCHLLGPRNDIPAIMAALDVVVSSSFGEGFPNVLGEAMAAGVPCVATDVGDSRLIVGETGRIVPPRDPAALAAGILDLLAMPVSERHALGRAARERIMQDYGLDAVAARYLSLYRETLAARRD